MEIICGHLYKPVSDSGEPLVDTGKVYSTLRHIKVTKSPGPDNIPNKILKTFAFELAPVVTDMYNASMVQGNFPQQLKRAFVIYPSLKYLLQDPSRTIYDQYLLRPR